MSVAIAAGSGAIALGPHGAEVARLERGNEFVVDFSFTTLFLLVLTIGMLFIMIALIVILTMTRNPCRFPGNDRTEESDYWLQRRKSLSLFERHRSVARGE
jgi:hypothetical protein